AVVGIGRPDRRGDHVTLFFLDDPRGVERDVADFVHGQAIAQDQPAILAERETDARLYAVVGLLERLFGEVAFAEIDREAREEVPVEERRLNEAELEVGELLVRGNGAGNGLAAAEEVALGDRDPGGKSFVRGESATEVEAAGGLFL